jgi:methylated-DNA-[protein]-cysteine S-methyltransferase
VTSALEALKSLKVRARFTQYSVPGWGVGELWTGDGLVLAHEFRYGAVTVEDLEAASDARAAPPRGAQSPSTGTLSGKDERVGNGFVPSSQHLGVARRAGGGSVGSPSRELDPQELVNRFRAFFAGEDQRFDDVEIDLDWATQFQRAVADALRSVPRGEVVSYGELAALAGYPGAARAAGTFCAHNRFMLIVPCHRVVGATGLGGYGSAGLGTKRRLLALEGVEL